MLLHGSRSGIYRSIKDEFESTRNYATHSLVRDPDGDYYTGWHVTVGEDEYSVHMSPREYGWNVRSESSLWFACELAQWDVRQAITDRQINALVAAVRDELIPVWGFYDWSVPGSIQMHSDRPPGLADGKTDTFPHNSPDGVQFVARVRAALLHGASNYA